MALRSVGAIVSGTAVVAVVMLLLRGADTGGAGEVAAAAGKADVAVAAGGAGGEISTVGSAVEQIAADTVGISFHVEATRPTLKEARAEVAAALGRVFAALDQLRLAGLQRRTESVTAGPAYERLPEDAPRDRVPKMIGFEVSTWVRLVLTVDAGAKPAEAGSRILDTLLENGVTNLGALEFSRSDAGEVARRLRTKAVQDAVANLRALAAGAGIGQFEVVSITEGPARGKAGVTFGQGTGRGPAELPFPLEVGQVVAACDVQVVARIAPRRP